MKTTMMILMLVATLATGCTNTVTPTAPEVPCDPEFENCESEGFAT